MRSSFICNCLHVTLLLFLFSACPTTHSSDYEVLLKLKSSMMGPQASGLEDWKHYLSPTAHCSFSGVSCDHDSRVISLNVSNIPLFGFIPSEIGLLNKLVNLTLAADNLTFSRGCFLWRWQTSRHSRSSMSPITFSTETFLEK